MPAEALRGSVNGHAKDLAGALSPYHLSRGGRDLRVFCFATAEAARAFHERFGGEVLSVSPTRDGHDFGTPRNCDQSGRALAPRWPHFLHRIRWANDGTEVSSGQASTSAAV
jgi:hypothetical protein